MGSQHKGLQRGDIIEIKDAKFLRSRAYLPVIIATGKTRIEKQEMTFPSIEECSRVRFLDEFPSNACGICEGFISQIHRIFSYYCKKCKKFTEEMCDCGNFPEPIFRISGIFSDGTKTMWFRTSTEKVTELLAGVEKSNSESVDIKAIMSKPYKFLGYLYDGNLYVEDVIK